MKKIILLLVLLLITLLCASCDYEGDEDRRKIGEALKKFQESINDSDITALDEIISTDYSYDNLNKEQFILNIVEQNLKIDGYSLGNIELKEDRAQAKVVTEWRMDGATTMVRVPVFQQQVPSMDMTSYSRVRFYLQKEDEKVWRIVMAEQLDKRQEGEWGNNPPEITELSYMPVKPRQGETVEMRIKIDKQLDDSSIFLAVNGVLVGGYSVKGLEKYQISDAFIQMFRIPADFPKRSFYEIKILVFEGKVNQLQIDRSELTGVQYKVIELPIS